MTCDKCFTRPFSTWDRKDGSDGHKITPTVAVKVIALLLVSSSLSIIDFSRRARGLKSKFDRILRRQQEGAMNQMMMRRQFSAAAAATRRRKKKSEQRVVVWMVFYVTCTVYTDCPEVEPAAVWGVCLLAFLLLAPEVPPA